MLYMLCICVVLGKNEQTAENYEIERVRETRCHAGTFRDLSSFRDFHSSFLHLSLSLPLLSLSPSLLHNFHSLSAICVSMHHTHHHHFHHPRFIQFRSVRLQFRRNFLPYNNIIFILNIYRFLCLCL